MDYTVLGILLARILEGVAYPFSKGSPQPRDQTQISHTALDSLPAEPPRKPKNTGVGSLSFLQQIFLTQESNRGQTCNAGRFFTNWAIREAFRGSKMSLNSNMWGVKVYPDINLQYCKKLLHQRIFVIKLLPYIYMPYIYIKCPIYNILGTYSSLRNISERKSYHPTESMALFNWQRFPLISAYNKDTSDSHRCHKVENTRKISFCKILGGQYFYWDNVTGCSPIIKSYTSLSTKT